MSRSWCSSVWLKNGQQRIPVVTGDPDTGTHVPGEGDMEVLGGLAPGQYTVYATTVPAAADALSGISNSDTKNFSFITGHDRDTSYTISSSRCTD